MAEINELLRLLRVYFSPYFVLYYTILIGIFVLELVGLYILILKSQGRKKKIRISAVRNSLLLGKESEVEDLLKNVLGEWISLELYMRVYYFISVGMSVVGILLLFTYSFPYLFVLAFLFVLLTYPKSEIFGIVTPFGLVMKLILKERHRYYDIEIEQMIFFLRNIALSSKGKTISASFALDQVHSFSRLLKPILATTIAKMDLAEDYEAVKYFKKMVATPIGEEFGNLMAKLNQMELSDGYIITQLEGIQKEIAEERKQRTIEKHYTASIYRSAPAAVLIGTVFFNFIVIVILYATDLVMNSLKF